MPATLLSHQALVLPLKLRWPRLFSGLALCIGSMAPDLEFIGRMHDDWIVSHTVGAQVWFTIPVTAALVWVVSALLIPVLLPYLPEHAWWRPHDLGAIQPPQSPAAWGRVAASAWVGGMSHVVLDGLTHGNHSGWLVPHLPLLRTLVPHVGGPVPLHDALQFWCTIVLAIVAIVLWRRMVRARLLWQWHDRAHLAERRIPVQPRVEGVRIVRVLVVAAVVGGTVGYALRGSASAKTMMAGTAFGAIDFTVGAAVTAAALRRWRRTVVPEAVY